MENSKNSKKGGFKLYSLLAGSDREKKKIMVTHWKKEVIGSRDSQRDLFNNWALSFFPIIIILLHNNKQWFKK